MVQLTTNTVSPHAKAAEEAKKKLENLKAKQGITEAASDWLDNERYSILLYGKPKVGKTWAYCSIIEDTVNKGKKVHIINTDAGLSSTFKAYFGDKYKEVAKSMNYYPCFDIKSGIAATNKIIKEAVPGDWVIVDLMSDFWQFSQDAFMESTGMSPDEYIRLASSDPRKFGLFDGNKWNYIKRLDNLITDVLPKTGNYNILAVTESKDIEVEKALTKTVVHEFDTIGFKPGGQKTLPHKFDTIVIIMGTATKKYKIVGHRGKKADTKAKEYGSNFWNELKKNIGEQQ